jgi:hypothetical protein
MRPTDFSTTLLFFVISLQPRFIMRSSEADINIAIKAIDLGQFRSNQSTADSYDVNTKTLLNRHNGIPCRADCSPNYKNLTNLEEKAIIEHALDVDTRGFQLNLDMLRDIADKLLLNRGQRRVSKNWPNRFVLHVLELKLRVNRRYDYQRALNKDPKVI